MIKQTYEIGWIRVDGLIIKGNGFWAPIRKLGRVRNKLPMGRQGDIYVGRGWHNFLIYKPVNKPERII